MYIYDLANIVVTHNKEYMKICTKNIHKIFIPSSPRLKKCLPNVNGNTNNKIILRKGILVYNTVLGSNLNKIITYL